MEFTNPATALKYHFQHNNVDVNIYFDAYDAESPSMSMILCYNNKYYYTSLNVNNTAVRKEYLEEVPSVILNQILDEQNRLDIFFENIEEHILNDDKMVINYKKDICFTNTMKYSRSRTDLPFLHSLRKVQMSNNMLERLSETMGIKRENLERIQLAGFTIVRTDDPQKRKSLSAIIDNKIILI